ncbi:phage tail protein [Marinobacterium lutimaris]|uniref:Prophage minor tail protein Z (GPZ) n=1 Tax=Marinobacterium lutimaris TaxID=568106 RepID=A0A1H5XSS9_9GAMM|nr:phage tail protein [Marinobacterium lutimaris]SEG14728.1 Prophage minor tail protein Z (GPZ) [Marinobacterium lutimaris]
MATNQLSNLPPIDVQVAQLIGRLSVIKDREIPQAQASALNRTLAVGRTLVSRAIAQQLKLPQRRVNRRLYIRRANNRELSGNLRVYHKGLPAIELPSVRDKGKYLQGRRGKVGSGVSARGGYRYPKGWIGKAPNGREQVFMRGADGGVIVPRIDLKPTAEKLTASTLESEFKRNYGPRLRADLQYRINKYRA